MNKEGDVALCLIKTLVQFGKLVGSTSQQFLEGGSGDPLPVCEIVEWPLVTDKIFNWAVFGAGNAICKGTICNHPIRGHGRIIWISVSGYKPICLKNKYQFERQLNSLKGFLLLTITELA